MNRVDREAHKIAESFDNLTKEDVRSIDQLYSNAAGITFLGKQAATLNQDDLRIALATLLSNVLKSIHCRIRSHSHWMASATLHVSAECL
jgi:hypothetical protein